jgi:hypothetical protein
VQATLLAGAPRKNLKAVVKRLNIEKECRLAYFRHTLSTMPGERRGHRDAGGIAADSKEVALEHYTQAMREAKRRRRGY